MPLSSLISESITSTKYLQFVRFRDLQFWDYNTYFREDIQNHNHPTVKLEELIKQRKWFITIDEAILYKRPTVKLYGKWVFLRDEIIGKDIKVKKQQVCRWNDLLVAEIDAKVWGFGIIPDYLEWAIVSSHYFLFEVDRTRLSLDFLSIYLKTEEFQKQVQATGSTNYAAIRPSHFLGYNISLPDLATQSRIVREYQDRISEAARLEQLARDGEKQIESYLIDALGITIEDREKKQGINFVRFKDLERWDVKNLISENWVWAKFEMRKVWSFLQSLNADNNGKGLRLDSKNTPTERFQYIGMEHIEKETGKLLETVNVNGKEIKSQTVKVPVWYFLYGKLRPYLNKYWYNHNSERVIASSEFFVFSVNEEKIAKQYFILILASHIIQKQIADLMAWARMPRINETNFKNLEIPLPPLSIQSEIVTYIESIKSTIATARAESERLRSEARESFERELFV